MILYMYIPPGQGQITSDDKISRLIYSFCTSIIFVKFHHDISNSKEHKNFFVHCEQGQIIPMGKILSITSQDAEPEKMQL